jgi:SAM-dependent methyltransferase
MIEKVHGDYRQELERQRVAWDRKPALRCLYHRWYQRMVAALGPRSPTVEIGAGCGNFKSYFPQSLATDVVRTGGWIERLVDAQELPFAADEVGNFVLIDVLHHLPRPLQFLTAAEKALQPQGRIVLLEPAGTPFARLLWKCCHHERFDLSVDLFNEAGSPASANADDNYSNMATATLLFCRNLQRTLTRVPDLRLLRREYSDFLVWPATGGFSYLGFIPPRLLPLFHRCEAWLTFPFASWLTGLRLLIVLEKVAGR